MRGPTEPARSRSNRGVEESMSLLDGEKGTLIGWGLSLVTLAGTSLAGLFVNTVLTGQANKRSLEDLHEKVDDAVKQSSQNTEAITRLEAQRVEDARLLRDVHSHILQRKQQ